LKEVSFNHSDLQKKSQGKP